MAITNTTRNGFHPEWLMGGNPRAIEAQEKRGQDELVTSNVFPVEVQGRDELEAEGVVFGDPVDGDSLFCHASIPDVFIGIESRLLSHTWHR